MSDLIQEPRSWVGHEHSGYRHELVWQPTKLKLGRVLFLASLALFVAMLWGVRS